MTMLEYPKSYYISVYLSQNEKKNMIFSKMNMCAILSSTKLYCIHTTYPNYYIHACLVN